MRLLSGTISVCVDRINATFKIISMSNVFQKNNWRLLITDPTDGATNMAIDEAILQALAEGHGQPTLRFYTWDPPCLSLGRGQSMADVDEAACEQLGYTWVRRATGGRAILHTDELTYSVITSSDDARVQGGIIESYRVLSQGLLTGLIQLGANAVQAEGEKAYRSDEGAACFDTPSYYEVTLNGKKLVGSAQVRRKRIVLQHGTLPLTGDITRIFDVLNLPKAEKAELRQDLFAHATTLEAEIGQQVSFESGVEALAQGFGNSLNLNLEPSALSLSELRLVDELRSAKYANDSWNRRV